MRDYFMNTRRWHLAAVAMVLGITAFIRWYRIDNCVMCSQDEWMTVEASFLFLQKIRDHGIIQAFGFEILAAFPLADIGRIGPPFDYTRTILILPTLPYYAIVGLFDFPVTEGWYRFPGTLWAFPAVLATYYFVYQLTLRRTAALFAMAMQATLLGHVVLTRFLVADVAFPTFYALAGGLWLQYLRNDNPRTRHLAYFVSFLYIATTPEGFIGLASYVSLVGLLLWQAGELKRLPRIFMAWPAVWIVGFYVFHLLVELKFYLHNPDQYPYHVAYLGRFFARGTGSLSFFPERVAEWYIYPNISLPLIAAAFLSLLLVRQREWWPVLIFGWVWSLFWVVMTLFVSNSSSNFIRMMHPMLILAALGFVALWDNRPRRAELAGLGFVAANAVLVYAYPLLCALPEDQNVAQAVGYLVHEHSDEWGEIGFYFPTSGLNAYLPDGTYTGISFFFGEDYQDCRLDLRPETVEDLDVIISMPDGYDTRQQISKNLDFAVFHDCEQRKIATINAYAAEHGFEIVGNITSEDGQTHAHIWARSPLDIGEVSIEEANRLHEERYSRLSWLDFRIG